MIHLFLETRINGAHADWVFQQFNRELFLRLSPPFPPSRLVRFDGCKTGDWVEVELLLPLMKQCWISEITNESHSPGKWHEFTDVGRVLPFFLTTWTHVHRVEQVGDDVVITDDIHYTVRNPFPDFLVKPAIRRVFTFRQPVYQSYFSQHGQK